MSEAYMQKIADSVLLRAVARLAMALALPMLFGMEEMGRMWLDGQFEKQAASISAQALRVDRNEKTAAAAIEQSGRIDNRLTVVETRQVTADAAAATFQRDTLARLDRLQENAVSISTAIAALTATMRAREDYDRSRLAPRP